ncbi:MAG: tyrosine-type recombinase/integrase [Thermodesulfovibrionales bacterium]
MSGIRYLYNHAALQEFDLEGLLDLTNLISTLPETLAFIRSLAVYLKSGRSLRKIDGYVGEPMSLSSFCTHWASIRKYIAFSWKRALDYLPLTDDQKLNLIMAMLRVKEELDSLSDTLPEALGLRILRESELRKVIDVFNPASKVYKPGVVALRNWAIFLILIDSGIRKGELLSLYIEDLPFRSTDPLRIRRRPDNPIDPRKKPPQVKTRNRQLTLLPQTVEAIQAYLEYRGNAKYPFLFLSDTNSTPLSFSSLNGMFKIAKKRSGINFSAHVLRKTRHYNRLWEVGEENRDTVRYEGGWSERSGIPPTYLKQYLIDKSNSTPLFFLPKLLGEN